MKIKEEDWKPVNNLVMEPAALSAITDSKNSLVIAGPGAGKTELLAQKVCYLLQTGNCHPPSKILAISFKKDAAVNLKERVGLRIADQLVPRFSSHTFDSFAKRILDRFINALPEEFRPIANYEIDTGHHNTIVQAFSECGINFHSKDLKKIHINKLTSTRIEDAEDPYRRVWTKLLKGEGKFNPTLTFPMISVLAIHIVENNPLIQKSLRKTYSHLFLDEFQDTTNIQYALLRACFYNTETALTAVGDNRQRIMLWAGAKSNVFATYKNDFQSKEYHLNMNHRSAPRLLNIQKIVNNYIHDIPFSPQPNSKWNSNDGIAEIWYSKNSIQETNHLAKTINELITQNKFEYRDICIIVKQQADKFNEDIACVLNNYNINVRNEVKYQDLLKEDLTILLLNTLKTSLNVKDSTAWAQVWDIMCSLHGYTFAINPNTIDTSRKHLKDQLKIIKNKLQDIHHQEELNVLLLDIIYLFDINKIKQYYPQYSQGKFMNKIREDLSELLYQSYLSHKDWLVAIDSFEGKDSIPLMTIHKSKGLEFEVVFFVGFDDDSFWSFSDQENEDTCTFFVGLSRAKSHLYFTFSNYRFGHLRTKTNILVLYQMLKESNVVNEKYLN